MKTVGAEESDMLKSPTLMQELLDAREMVWVRKYARKYMRMFVRNAIPLIVVGISTGVFIPIALEHNYNNNNYTDYNDYNFNGNSKTVSLLSSGNSTDNSTDNSTVIAVGPSPLEIWALDRECFVDVDCPASSSCSLGTCYCDHGWATKDRQTCKFKLRCQLTTMVSGVGPFGSVYWSLKRRTEAIVMLCFAMTGIGNLVAIPWAFIASIQSSANT